MARSTRREFLDEAFFATALAGLAARGAFAETLAPAPAPRRQGANDRLRLACIGVRGRGVAHVEGYLDLPDAEVAAVCDIDLGVVGKAVSAVEKKTGKKPDVLQDLRKVFERKDIDAVSLALPIHWHTLASVWAMESGKHVYCEKPVSHNVREGRRIHEASLRYKRVGQTGTQSRSAKAIRDAIAHVHSGGIGKVITSRGLCYKPRTSIGIQPDAPVPAGVDFDLWLGPAPKRAFNPNAFHYNWHWMWDTGAGDLGNQGIHQMDIARWALGKSTLPRTVLSVGGRLGYVDQGQTPNTLVAHYDYDDAALIFEVRGLPTPGLVAKGSMPGVQIGNIIRGDRGYVAMSSDYGKAAAFDLEGNVVASWSGGGNHFVNFVAAAKAGRPDGLNAPVLEGHLSSALCHLGNVSYKLGSERDASSVELKHPDMIDAYERMAQHLSTNGVDLSKTRVRVGQRIEVDARKEGLRDPKADALCTREYRSGFVVPGKI